MWHSALATVDNGPSQGSRLTGKKGFDWKLATTSDGILDFDALFQPEVSNDLITGYAFCYVTSPDEQNIAMLVGSDDGIVVWVNGEEVHRNPVFGALILDEDRFSIHL